MSKQREQKFVLPHLTLEELELLWNFTESVREVPDAYHIDLIAAVRAKLLPAVEKARGTGSDT
jgi:hypothetical protein